MKTNLSFLFSVTLFLLTFAGWNSPFSPQSIARGEEGTEVQSRFGICHKNKTKLYRGSQSVSPKAAQTAASDLDDLVWELMGFRYAPMSKDDYQRVAGYYLKDRPDGGVAVKTIRNDSPIAKQGVKPGDIIVGIHDWVTTSQNDVRYIAANWSTIQSSNGTVQIQLFRNGKLYFTEIPLK